MTLSAYFMSKSVFDVQLLWRAHLSVS